MTDRQINATPTVPPVEGSLTRLAHEPASNPPLLESLMDSRWRRARDQVAAQLRELDTRLRWARSNVDVLPTAGRELRALCVAPEDVNVVILGQDPYPDPRYATGWAFSVPAGAHPLPGSLRNIFAERATDLGSGRPAGPANGDLTHWVEQGVLLLNTVLTVEAGRPGSHRRWGWQVVTSAVLDEVERVRGGDVVFLLWGRQAQIAAAGRSGVHHHAAHPSPLSASRGFFGSRPFSHANEALSRMGLAEIDWSTP